VVVGRRRGGVGGWKDGGGEEIQEERRKELGGRRGYIYTLSMPNASAVGINNFLYPPTLFFFFLSSGVFSVYVYVQSPGLITIFTEYVVVVASFFFGLGCF
jgi:hypothetical protein